MASDPPDGKTFAEKEKESTSTLMIRGMGSEAINALATVSASCNMKKGSVDNVSHVDKVASTL